MEEGFPVDWQVYALFSYARNTSDNLQDLIARFTLDSATEFLFGKDVESLADPLPYPSTAGVTSSLHAESQAAAFSNAFMEALIISANRPRSLIPWPLLEPFEDKVMKHIKVIDKYLDPILKAALARKRVDESETGISEDDTLLSHLVNLTDGMCIHTWKFFLTELWGLV